MEEKRTLVTIEMPIELKETLSVLAKESELTLSSLIRLILKKYIKNINE